MTCLVLMLPVVEGVERAHKSFGGIVTTLGEKKECKRQISTRTAMLIRR